MKTLKKVKGFSVFIIVVLLLLTACKGSNTQVGGASKSKDTMFLGMVNPPASFNPINTGDVAGSFAENFVFDPLLNMVDPLDFRPKLANSIETKDNQTYVIHLNEKAKWTDGEPVTAKDVAFTFDLIANPKTETSRGSNISTLEGVDAAGKLPKGQTKIPSLKIIDDHTMSFKTKKPVDPNYIKEMIGTQILTVPEHILKDVAPEDLAKNSFMQKPTVTDGPYKFETYKKDAYIQFKANRDYYLGKPKTENIYVKLMDAPSLVVQLKTGEINMNVAQGIGNFTFQDYDTVKKMKNVNTKINKQIGFQTMEFNTKTITNPEVRKAMVYAINRTQIVDKLLKGNGEIIDGPYTSLTPYQDKSIKPIPYDPNKAKQMLKEAGYDFSKTLNLVVPIGNKVRENSANIIAQNLKAAGVKVKTTTYDFPTIMQKGKAGDFDLLLIGFTFTLDPDVTSLYSTGGVYNFMGYSNPKVDDLLLKGKTEPDAKKRHSIYNQLQQIWEKDMPVITLYSDYQIVAITKNVAQGSPRPFGTTFDLQKWTLKGAK